MQALQVIELFAGLDANGQAVIERMPVKVNEEDDSCQLVKSPAFVKGIASGDVIKLRPGSQDFELIERSGNLCIRVLSRVDISPIAEALGPALEKLGGELDTETERMLVFSIHVSCGFKSIEALINQHVDGQNSVWMYGNVYDPKDGETPLDWWQPILDEK